MKPAQWKLVQEVFEVAADLDGTRRAEFLAERCAGDPALRHEVESLLAAATNIDGFLERPPAVPTTVSDDDPVEIDRYRLLRHLGTGGMGVVHLAERSDDAFHQLVAVKILKLGLDTEDFVQRFRLERQTLASLRHPNIARLIDGGRTTDGRPYLVLEHVDGAPIDRFCDERKLDVRSRVALVVKVCDAVAHAHRALVVHRDIKPSNVLVDADGEPKLLDFGVAKILDPAVANGVATETGHRMMTPRYASPEQVRGEPITTATDVYALGVLLYELLTGGPPYDVATAGTAELERQVCEKTPVRPSVAVARGTTVRSEDVARTRRELRGDLDTIVLTALRKEPWRRYATVAELTTDLRRFLANEPILAQPPSARYRIGSFVRRRRAALRASGAGVFVGLVAAAVVFVGLVLMPRWSAEARRDAHAILVGPDQQAAIVTVVFFLLDGRGEFADDEARDLEGLALAERRLARAARLDPLDATVRRERGLVAAARLLRRLPDDAPIPPAVLAWLEEPVARALRADDLDRAIAGAAPTTLRELGLLLMLARPGRDAINVMRAYESVAQPDPLVEGLLGQFYLSLGHPELAYPRIRAAHESFPETRAMTLALAESASGVRDHARAMWLVERAEAMPSRDPFDRLARVRASVLAAAGETTAARVAFERATRAVDLGGTGHLGHNPVACAAYGRFLEEQGEVEEALRAYAQAVLFTVHPIERAPGAALVAYVRLLDHWMASWSAETRERQLSVGDEAPPTDAVFAGRTVPFTLRDKLRYYTLARAELMRRPARIAVYPEEAAAFAAERKGWGRPTPASRLADAIAAGTR